MRESIDASPRAPSVTAAAVRDAVPPSGPKPRRQAQGLIASASLAGRWSSGASRPASWTASRKAATARCSSSSAATAGMIPVWITTTSPRGFSRSAGPTPSRPASPHTSNTCGNTAGWKPRPGESPAADDPASAPFGRLASRRRGGRQRWPPACGQSGLLAGRPCRDVQVRVGQACGVGGRLGSVGPQRRYLGRDVLAGLPGGSAACPTGWRRRP